jgi:uncharacterized small protein (DUF1192 family)
MLIKFEVDDRFAEKIKAMTDERVGSKAFVAAAHKMMELHLQCIRYDAEVTDLQARVALLEQTIERGRLSAKAFLEVCGQGDLLNG